MSTVYVVVKDGMVTDAYSSDEEIDVEVIDIDDLRAGSEEEYENGMKLLDTVSKLPVVY